MGRKLQPGTADAIVAAGTEGKSVREIHRMTGTDRAAISSLLRREGLQVGELHGKAKSNPATPEDAGTVLTKPSHSKRVAFDWNFTVAGAEAAGIDTQPLLDRLQFPATLSTADVRALRDHVAAQHRLEAAAARMGIDRWTGRHVVSAEDLQVVAEEIRGVLAGFRDRYRLGAR